MFCCRHSSFDVYKRIFKLTISAENAKGFWLNRAQLKVILRGSLHSKSGTKYQIYNLPQGRFQSTIKKRAHVFKQAYSYYSSYIKSQSQVLVNTNIQRTLVVNVGYRLPKSGLLIILLSLNFWYLCAILGLLIPTIIMYFLLKLFVFGNSHPKNDFYIGLLITVGLTLIKGARSYHNIIEEISVLSGNSG